MWISAMQYSSKRWGMEQSNIVFSWGIKTMMMSYVCTNDMGKIFLSGIYSPLNALLSFMYVVKTKTVSSVISLL